MGEAKRKLLRIAKAPCLCGSQRVAETCCLVGKDWQKPPAILGLKALSHKSTLKKCYLGELSSCDGTISGEHLLSESVIKVLDGEGKIIVSGTPWLRLSESKTLGPKSLIAKCLCQRHNSALSPLDVAARDLFKNLNAMLEGQPEVRDFLLSGHDIERWLLKTLKAFAISGNLTHDNVRLAGELASDIPLINLLDDSSSWPEGSGLYCIGNAGDLAELCNHFQITPLASENGSIGGLMTNILGFRFLLTLKPLDRALNPDFVTAVYRPGKFIIQHPAVRSSIILSWVDGLTHPGTLIVNM